MVYYFSIISWASITFDNNIFAYGSDIRGILAHVIYGV